MVHYMICIHGWCKFTRTSLIYRCAISRARTRKTCHDWKGLDYRENGTCFASSEKDPAKKTIWFWTLPVLTWSMEKGQWVLSTASFFFFTPTPSRYQSQLGTHTPLRVFRPLHATRIVARFSLQDTHQISSLWWPQITIPIMAVENQNSKSIVENLNIIATRLDRRI